jgi:hypothetical protein
LIINTKNYEYRKLHNLVFRRFEMQRKKKICVECGNEDFIFSKGRCKFCAVKSYGKPKQVSEKKMEAKKKQSSARSVYFDTLITLCKFSEESGERIYSPNRSNICHIFPKRIYKSIDTFLDNYVYLTLDEHTRFDYLLDTLNFEALEAEFPKAWKIAISRVKKLIPHISENGKLKLKFEEYLENQN